MLFTVALVHSATTCSQDERFSERGIGVPGYHSPQRMIEIHNDAATRIAAVLLCCASDLKVLSDRLATVRGGACRLTFARVPLRHRETVHRQQTVVACGERMVLFE